MQSNEQLRIAQDELLALLLSKKIIRTKLYFGLLVILSG